MQDKPPLSPFSPSSAAFLREHWSDLDDIQKIEAFNQLPFPTAKDFFQNLRTTEQSALLLALAPAERGPWVRILPPDDLADLIQAIAEDRRQETLQLLDPATRSEVIALLAYDEDEAGGVMNPRFARLRPDMTVDEALRYLRRQAPHVETTQYAYIIDNSQRLLGVCSLRELFVADGSALVKNVMQTALVVAPDTLAQEPLAKLFLNSGFNALPIVDESGKMVGIVTSDDIVQVVEEEATEDIQRLGGSDVLDAPYLVISIRKMVRKRAGWLVALFLGEMLTATAMGYFEHELTRAIVLALFIPLIISSGGNSGSQASTLVVRALALREIKLTDWWRVFTRELVVGSALGLILGMIGFLRIYFWPTRETTYGEHYALVGMTVGITLVGVVLWGSLVGSMLPFVLKKLKLDPATASAPFVATLVDVCGLIIYFSVASITLVELLSKSNL
jgi:magnesium transporter